MDPKGNFVFEILPHKILCHLIIKKKKKKKKKKYLPTAQLLNSCV